MRLRGKRVVAVAALALLCMLSSSVVSWAQSPEYHGHTTHLVSGTRAVWCVATGRCWQDKTTIVYQAGRMVVKGTYSGKAITAHAISSKRVAAYIEDGRYQATQVSGQVKASTVVTILVATINAPTEIFAVGTVIAVCPYGVSNCQKYAGQANRTTTS